MKRRGGLGPGLLTVLLAAIACGHSPTEVRFVDLVAGQGLRVDGRPLRPAEIVAVDETWLSVTFNPGDEARGEAEVSGAPSLRLAGCLECSDGLDVAAVGRLDVRIRASRGRGVDLPIELDAAEGWWDREVDLGEMADAHLELALDAVIPRGCVVRLREATLRHVRAIPDAEPDQKTQVLLISVDTLRNDSLGSSDTTSLTPNLDRFALEGERWTTVYAAASWTKPSHASMLTGYRPETHRAVLLDQAMDPAVPTLAERFRDAGFATGALVFDCTWLSPRWGFSKGFDSYRVTPFRAGRQLRDAAAWVLDHRDRDFFFFLHTFEPHTDFSMLPYEAPGLSRRTIADEFGVQGFGCRRGRCAARFVTALSDHEIPGRPKDAEILHDTYLRGVHYLDDSLGGLFEILRESGLWESLLVVVTSDHGEEFFEHGGYGHHTVYDEVLRVPLIIKWPSGKRAGRINGRPSSGVDLAPTLLESAGVAAPDLPGARLQTAASAAPIIAGTLEHAVVADGYKGIFGGRQPARVFDLGADPGEETDIAGLRPDIVEMLESILDAQRREALALYRSFGAPGNTGPVELSEKERERLEAFGYLH